MAISSNQVLLTERSFFSLSDLQTGKTKLNSNCSFDLALDSNQQKSNKKNQDAYYSRPKYVIKVCAQFVFVLKESQLSIRKERLF